MTRQEAFDRAWGRFVVEGHGQSVSDRVGGPSYRGDGGARCAIGLLVTNREYRRGWEGVSLDGIFSSLPGRVADLGFEFLRDLQNCHDYACGDAARFRPNIERRLRDLAATYGLTVMS